MSKKAPAPPSDPLAYFIHGQRFYACDCALMEPPERRMVRAITKSPREVRSWLDLRQPNAALGQ